MARPASNRSPLVPILCLLVGLAAGWSTNLFGAGATQAGAPARAAASATAPDVPRSSGRAVLEEAELESAARERAPGDEPASPAAVEPALEAPGEPAPASLLVELTTLLRSGRIEAALSVDAQRLLRYAVEAYLTAGAPREALALLERHPEIESNQFMRVGHVLLGTEDREGAALAFLAALERAGEDGFDVDDLQMLSQADPAAALAFLDGRAGQMDEFLERQVLPQRALLLARTGQIDASLSILGRLAVDGALDAEALAALESLPDERAEAFLREVSATDPQGASTVALAGLLGRSERTAEAVELLRRLLARQPENLAALSTLFGLDPAASLEHLSGSQREMPPQLWTQAGNALAAQGRTGEAVDAWLRAFEGDPSDWESADALAAHAPQVLWPRTEHMAANTTDDELLGDLADLNWRAGRQDRAVELWRRARGIDPGDSEWINKLRAVALGRDPL